MRILLALFLVLALASGAPAAQVIIGQTAGTGAPPDLVTPEMRANANGGAQQ